MKKIIIGNKSDLEEKSFFFQLKLYNFFIFRREVGINEGINLAKEFGVEFSECSAKNKETVEQCLIKIIDPNDSKEIKAEKFVTIKKNSRCCEIF